MMGQMVEPLATGRSAGSLAWAGLANAYYWIDPVRKVTGVFATQILPFCDVKALPLFHEFETAVYRAHVKLTAEDLASDNVLVRFSCSADRLRNRGLSGVQEPSS